MPRGPRLHGRRPVATTSQRFTSLDGLRGLAALAVVLHHAMLTAQPIRLHSCLVHEPIIVSVVIKRPAHAGVPVLAIGPMVSLAVAWVVFTLVEGPAHRLSKAGVEMTSR